MTTATKSKPKIASKPNGKPHKPPGVDVAGLCRHLQALQRQRAVVLKSRNMMSNRLQALVAGTLGYDAHMPEKERLKKFKEAAAVIKRVLDLPPDDNSASGFSGIIRSTMVGIDAFNKEKHNYELRMEALSKQLPAHNWVKQPSQRGFGTLFLAIVIGETGDLFNYANPAKVWRRLGCAPWQFDGKTQMGATWKSGRGGKLSAEEWQKFGYSPRRRSIAYLIGEGIVKQNGAARTDEDDGVDDTDCCIDLRPCGPYRARYDAAKVKIKESHPDYSDLRCHRHGMLLATKLLLKNLWCVWHGKK